MTPFSTIHAGSSEVLSSNDPRIEKRTALDYCIRHEEIGQNKSLKHQTMFEAFVEKIAELLNRRNIPLFSNKTISNP